MNKNTLEGDWKIVKGTIKEKWGKLTEDDLTEIDGKKDQLLGKIQKRYGIAKDKAEQELSDWEKHSKHQSHLGAQVSENHAQNKHINKH